eukprot:CAMPEP_0174757846 /NCGR_PEP_ID=MMETSP1094-20130205/107465_1 /TAXON_ID=156173 /ORGANISM="Chrysochromulina brevifilum, Strain UTEX LB 985" /LENGTH=54 /DNA_ID=CAMNT_0015963763 /DNA_START=595 /DNA_END=759 /DNA_ORIENTATION=+
MCWLRKTSLACLLAISLSLSRRCSGEPSWPGTSPVGYLGLGDDLLAHWLDRIAT